EAFEILEEKVEEYLLDKPDGYELRVWSIACSTGEEAYSLAILISKISKKLHKTFNVSIFATDIDDKALSVARKAYYSKEVLKNLPKDLLNEYFIANETGYTITSSLREKIVFTNHNLLSDPPFINQDLISCRNLLIYIIPEAQQDIFTLFHYVLKEHGLLFLGSSESTLMSAKYFMPIDSEHKIYKKEKLKNPPRISSHYFTKHISNKEVILNKQFNKKNDKSIQQKIANSIFDFFAAEFILVDKDYSIVYKKGNLPFLKMNDGFVSLNIIDNLDNLLKYDVKELLNEMFQKKELQTSKFIELQTQEFGKFFVRVIIYPFHDMGDSTMALLYFQQLSSADFQFSSQSLIFPDQKSMIDNLLGEISELRERNHNLLDELKVDQENMQLLNEELQSSNEELQSSNEELETSNEELQSSNEELHITIQNMQELKNKLSLILNSTQDGIIGLDMQGNHTFANDAALTMLGFNLDELLGRNAHDLWHHTDKNGHYVAREKCKIHNSLIKGESFRAESLFWRKDRSSLEVAFLQNPIIKNNIVVGSVISFHDISEINRLKRLNQQEHQLAELFLKTKETIVMTLDINGLVSMINEQGCTLLKTSNSAIIGKNWFDNFIPHQNIKEIKGVFQQVMLSKENLVSHYTNRVLNAKGEILTIAWTNSLLYDTQKNIIGILTSGINVTKEENLYKMLHQQKDLYKLTFEEADIGIAHISLKGKWIDTNEYLTKLLGYTKSEFKKLSIDDISLDSEMYDKELKEKLLQNRQENYHQERQLKHKNGSVIWVSLSVVLLRNTEGEPLYFLEIIKDISEIKLLMYQLQQEKNQLKDIIEFTPLPVMLHSKEGKILLVNKVFRENIGYSKEELSDMHSLLENLYEEKDRESANNFYNNIFKSSVIKKEQHTIYTKNKEEKIGILNSILLQNSFENSTVALTAMIDITELQKKEELMIAQSRQAAMGEMLAMIAHQWRQPLTVISMASNNIHAKLELEEEMQKDELQELVKDLDKQTEYLSHTIDDFRDFFKPESQKEFISVEAIITKLLTLVEKSLEANAIIIKLPKSSQIMLLTYPNQLIQVLLNLTNNAKDAIIEHNPLSREIELTLSENDDMISLGICDSGGGIKKSVLSKLGQPYVSTKSKNGTGLGIYMSKTIVSKYLHGHLHWTTNSHGSCFYIDLPKGNSIDE
ncbi:MAG: PAS domain S-box protein, partial [Sulfurimonas sp.]|nr:PAS domain S-box protein [Sulfurimonas sp.]